MDLINKLLIVFFKHQITLKMFHFQTQSYGYHKTSDLYLETFMKNFDRFMEVAQGVFGRTNLTNVNINIYTANDQSIEQELTQFVSVLRGLDTTLTGYPELLNLRDEIVAEANQFKYLLTFK